MVLAEADTKGKILDVAEELFSERGFLNTSLRAITQQAGVNLAAVNYHFGGKDALIFAVFERFVTPLNEERLAFLEEAEAAAGPEGPSVEAVCRAFLQPVTRLWTEPRLRPRRMKLMARAMVELGPKWEELKNHLFAGIFRRFLPAFENAAPQLDRNELFWRFYFVVGAMNFAFHARERSEDAEEGIFPKLTEDCVPEMLLQHMITTFSAPAMPGLGAHPDAGESDEGVGR